MDVPAPQAGTVAEVKVAVGDRVGEGAVILLLEPEGAAAIPPKEQVKEGAAPGLGRARDLRLQRRRLRDDRGQGPRHRRLQGRAGDRGPCRRGGHGQGRGPAADPGVRQGHHGRAVAGRRHGHRPQGQGRRPGGRGDADPAPADRRRQAGRGRSRSRAAGTCHGTDAQGRQRGQGRLSRRGAGAGRRPRRLLGRLPRRRPRPPGGPGRALADPGRGLPQRRLHPVQGAAPRRQGDRRVRGDGPFRRQVRRTHGRHRRAARLEGRRGQEADRRALGPRQGAQGHGRLRASAGSPRSTSSRSRTPRAARRR